MNDRAKRALGVLQHNTHNMLSLVLSGTDYIVHDDDADYSIEDISGMTDDDVKRSDSARKGRISVAENRF